jgi:rubrerythrin
MKMNIEELKIIKQAILNELEGYEFYKMAGNQSGSKEVKDAFLELAQEEMKHINWLNELFNKIKGGKEDELTLAFLENTSSPKIFNWENLDRKDAGISVSVFGIGIQMERAAIQFYMKAEEQTKLPDSKKLFEKLIVWEQAHLDQFASQYEKLKESWWADQDYAPF